MCNRGIFQGRGCFLDYGYFYKSFIYDIQKKNLVFFSKVLLKLHFKWEPVDADKQGTFLKNQGTFFLKLGPFFVFLKQGKGDLHPLPQLVAPLENNMKFYQNIKGK